MGSIPGSRTKVWNAAQCSQKVNLKKKKKGRKRAALVKDSSPEQEALQSPRQAAQGHEARDWGQTLQKMLCSLWLQENPYSRALQTLAATLPNPRVPAI